MRPDERDRQIVALFLTTQSSQRGRGWMSRLRSCLSRTLALTARRQAKNVEHPPPRPGRRSRHPTLLAFWGTLFFGDVRSRAEGRRRRGSAPGATAHSRHCRRRTAVEGQAIHRTCQVSARTRPCSDRVPWRHRFLRVARRRRQLRTRQWHCRQHHSIPRQEEEIGFRACRKFDPCRRRESLPGAASQGR